MACLKVRNLDTENGAFKRVIVLGKIGSGEKIRGEKGQLKVTFRSLTFYLKSIKNWDVVTGGPWDQPT